MTFVDRVSVLVLTYNEAPNIGRTLAALTGFPDVVVLDSGSTDETAEIAKGFANVRFVVRPFDDHASQWNFGLQCCDPKRDWVLALDADYVLTEPLAAEMASLDPDAETSGFRVSFDYAIHGKKLRGSLYPPVICLFRRGGSTYVQEGHTQRVVLNGAVRDLAHHICHDDRKPLSRWLESQKRYARLEADYLCRKKVANMRRTDRIRLRGWLAPPLVFLYTLLWKRCFLDGKFGYYYVLQRTVVEILIALELFDRRFISQHRDL